MQADSSAKTTGRLAALAQAGLAALVAGSLLSFSMIAINTAFDGPATSRGIDISAPRTAPTAPVVLPIQQDETENAAPVTVTAASQAPVIVADAPQATVLGTRTQRPARRDNSNDKDKKDQRKWSFPEGRRTLTGYYGGPRSGDSDDEHENTTGKGHIKARGNGHHKDQHDADTNNGSLDEGRSKPPKDDHPKKGKKEKKD